MDPVTVNITATLSGVIFLTCLAIAAFKIVRSRRDTQDLGNRSVKVPFSNDSPVFDPTSSGLDEEVEVEKDVEVEEVIATETVEIEEPDEKVATVVAEIAGKSIFASVDSEADDEIQDIETIETTEEIQPVAAIEEEEADDEPTGVIAEGLIGEFLGTSESESDQIEVEAADEGADTELEAPILEEVSEEIEAAEMDEIEDYFDPEQPAFAARASVPTSTAPLFKVAPPSVPDEQPETIEAQDTNSRDDSTAEVSEAPEVNDQVVAEEPNIALDATVPIQRVDVALEPTVPIVRPDLPAQDYSFEEVPKMEIVEDEVVLGEEITNQITQLDADLDTIEELVREIELSLADFEPLSGFEISNEDKAA